MAKLCFCNQPLAFYYSISAGMYCTCMVLVYHLFTMPVYDVSQFHSSKESEVLLGITILNMPVHQFWLAFIKKLYM